MYRLNQSQSFQQTQYLTTLKKRVQTANPIQMMLKSDDEWTFRLISKIQLHLVSKLYVKSNKGPLIR